MSTPAPSFSFPPRKVSGIFYTHTTMNIALLPVDSTYPNLALMKLSAWHKKHGDTVQWYNPLGRYDKVYMAKVFSFTPDYGYYINADEVEKGGTGYDLHKTLPKSIDRIQPDYTIYPQIDRHQDRIRIPDPWMPQPLQVVRSAEERGEDYPIHGRGRDSH